MFSPPKFSDRTNWKLAQNRFTQALEEVRAGGAKVLDLTVSNPTRVGLHYDEQAISRALASPRALDYDPQSKGLLRGAGGGRGLLPLGARGTRTRMRSGSF